MIPENLPRQPQGRSTPDGLPLPNLPTSVKIFQNLKPLHPHPRGTKSGLLYYPTQTYQTLFKDLLSFSNNS